MKFQSLVAGALFASSALAAPTSLEARALPIDVTVLEFALTLEHLENVFYKGALQKFTEQDFINAGYSTTYYNNLMYIAHDEEVHVQALTAAIQAAGYEPVAACQYSFPYTDVSSFITLSSVLEGVGTSAYLGAAGLITIPAYLTVAGSILATEALHTSYQRAAKGEVPMANPFETPLDPMSVYTLAAAFITSCPASNVDLGFTSFPSLTYDAAASCTCEEPNCAPDMAIKKRGEGWSSWSKTSSTPPTIATPPTSWSKSSSAPPTIATPPTFCAPPTAGASIMLTAALPIPADSWVTFVNGLSVTSVQGTISGATITVVIPAANQGQTYVFITNMDVQTTFSDAAVLYGPAIVEVTPPVPTLNYSLQ